MEYLNFSAACARTFENRAMLTIMKRAMANRFDWMHILMSSPFAFGSGDCSVSATSGFSFLFVSLDISLFETPPIHQINVTLPL